MIRHIYKVALGADLDIDKFADFCKENYNKFHLCGSWIDQRHADALVRVYKEKNMEIAHFYKGYTIIERPVFSLFYIGGIKFNSMSAAEQYIDEGLG